MDTAVIKLNLSSGKETVIDLEDLPRASGRRWYLEGNGYVRGNFRVQNKWVKIPLSRFILNAPKGMVVDHINHDKLDNRKSNLRLCTISQNTRNQIGKPSRRKSKYRGVDHQPCRPRNPWRVNFLLDGKKTILGSFPTEEEAAYLRDTVAREVHGEFAWFNTLPADFIPTEKVKRMIDKFYKNDKQRSKKSQKEII